MIEALFNFILDLFFWLVGVIGSIVIYPVQALLVTIFPELGDFISVVLGFFNNQLFPMVSFVKDLFLDLTCCPRALFSIFITFSSILTLLPQLLQKLLPSKISAPHF